MTATARVEARQKKAIKLLTNAGINPKTLNIDGAKDPDEYIKKYGALKFKILLEHSGDSISYELERCKNGIDVETAHGRAELLKRTITVITNIENDYLRNTYISQIAAMCGVQSSAVSELVNKSMRSKKSKNEQEKWREIKRKTIVSQDSTENEHTARAEKNIISYLLRFPEENSRIAQLISEEFFQSPCYRNIFREILENNIDLDSIAYLGEKLHTSEISKLYQIRRELNNIIQNEVTLQDSIDALFNYQNNGKKDVLTEEDLSNLLERYKGI